MGRSKQPSKQPNEANRPKPLRPGQGVVALVAPAFSFDHGLLAQGRAFLENHYGFRTHAQDNVYDSEAYFAGSDQRREDELFHCLTHPDIDAVFSIRGGYGSARIYPRLLERLRKHYRKNSGQPRILLGYSDITILLNGLYQDLGWMTFHGPVVAGRPFREPLPIEEETFRKCVQTAQALGPVRTTETAMLSPGTGKGRLVGGCLSLVVSTLGTPYEIDTNGKVLFLEDVDEKPYRLDRMLTQLVHAGKFDRVKGIVFGELFECEPAPRDPNKTTAMQAIRLALGEVIKKKRIPVLTGFPAGHGTPQITFPIGGRVELRADEKTAELIFLE